MTAPNTIDEGSEPPVNAAALSTHTIPTDRFLVYGSSEDNSDLHIYCRYAMGDDVTAIARDYGRSVPEVMKILKSRPIDYLNTKKSREAFEKLRIHRSLSVGDKVTLEKLERMSGQQYLDKDDLSYLAKTVKELAHRHALNEGNATHKVDIEVRSTRDEVMQRMLDEEAAGDGVDLGETGPRED